MSGATEAAAGLSSSLAVGLTYAFIHWSSGSCTGPSPSSRVTRGGNEADWASTPGLGYAERFSHLAR